MPPPGRPVAAARAGQPEVAATLFGAAATLGASTAVDPQFPPSRETADAGLAVARRAVSEEAFLAAWERGRSTTSDEVAELAAQVVADVTDPESLAAVAERTRVVITTVGPYLEHGEPLVAACAAAHAGSTSRSTISGSLPPSSRTVRRRCGAQAAATA